MSLRGASYNRCATHFSCAFDGVLIVTIRRRKDMKTGLSFTGQTSGCHRSTLRRTSIAVRWCIGTGQGAGPMGLDVEARAQ